MLWRTRGGFTATVKFDEELDLIEFGDRNAGPYWATHEFKIDHDGNWSANFSYKFKQPPSTVYPPADPWAPKTPFFAHDYSRETVNAAVRARKLAKPTRWGENGRTDQEFADLLNLERVMNETINLSFEYSWSGQGKW
jgi:hypothetical protein